MRQRKGFTLIEMTVVVALAAIIAAIAIPNLMHHRILANEAAAVTRLKAYATAQETFQRGRQGRMAVNTNSGPSSYCDNFRNLYYGVPVDGTPEQDLLKLIAKEHADAYGFGANDEKGNTLNPPANTVGNPDTPTTATDAGVPYKGYFFLTPGGLPGPNSTTTSTPLNPNFDSTKPEGPDNPRYLDPIAYGRREGWFSTLYAQLAIPALVGSTGTSAFYIGIDGRIWRNSSLTPGDDIVKARNKSGEQLYIRQGNPAGMYDDTSSLAVNARARRNWHRE